jgi:SAM-dependent methyltransferase
MALFYKVAYRIGLKPWEEMAVLPIAEQILSLFDREESGRRPPYGSALDLGCGSGIWSVRLAQRGWQVTGIDIVAKALSTARKRISEAGAEVKLVQGDLTALRSAGVGAGFRFVLDLGAIHGLTDAQREAAGREVSAVTDAGATMILLAWVPGHRGPLPRGMSREDVRNAFPEWKIIAEDAADVTGAPGFVKKAKPHFYRLCRE